MIKFNNPTMGAINRKDFQRQITLKIGGPKTSHSWVGYKFRNIDSDDSEFNVLF
jgi:hypothetical protein